MSAERIEEIRKRAEAATPGPWHGERYDGRVCAIVSAERDVLYGTIDNAIGGRRKDIEFILNAREDIPALLAEVERLKYALESIANSDGWILEPAPLFTIEGAYDKCVDIATEAVYGEGDK